MPKTKPAASLHARLLDGLDVHSRQNGAVHSIHGADGKTVAEVCVGSSGRVRLNFRTKPSSVPKGVTLEGRSTSWPGGGVVVTDANLAAARSLLAGYLKPTTKQRKPRATTKPDAASVAADAAAREAERKAEAERLAALARKRETADAA